MSMLSVWSFQFQSLSCDLAVVVENLPSMGSFSRMVFLPVLLTDRHCVFEIFEKWTEGPKLAEHILCWVGIS